MIEASLATGTAQQRQTGNRQVPARLLCVYDMDGTTVPQGNQDDFAQWLPVFNKFHNDQTVSLSYATGRDREAIEDGIEQCRLPKGEFAVASVGTELFERQAGELSRNQSYDAYIRKNTPGWDVEKIIAYMKGQRDSCITEQENHDRWQHEFKSSWLVKPSPEMLQQYGSGAKAAEEVAKKVEAALKQILSDAPIKVIDSYSTDRDWGFIDVLPACATKIGGVEFVRVRLLGLGKDQTVYGGDTGNDRDGLTNGYWSVLVGNSSREVQERIRREAEEKGLSDRLYIAKGHTIAGIMEGLNHFNLADESFSPVER